MPASPDRHLLLAELLRGGGPVVPHRESVPVNTWHIDWAARSSASSSSSDAAEFNDSLQLEYEIYDLLWRVMFGLCRNKEPHSSGILLCRVVVVGYENINFQSHISRQYRD